MRWVTGVHLAAADTDMAAGQDTDKTTPQPSSHCFAMLGRPAV